jgi:hypothetical protein
MSTTINNQTLESLVKCAICLDYYNDPRCLPCSHTFCYECINKLCEEGIGQCPMRDNSIFFRHTIDKLPVNRIAKDLVECLNKSSSLEIKCDHCKQILSEFFCETCSKNYCTICLKLEHDINQFKNHQINIIINQNSNQFCLEHTEEKQKYWCNDCQQLVCSDCLLFKHKQHGFITSQNISQQIKNEFDLSMKKIIQMKIDLEKLNEKTNETYHYHYQIHHQTINSIEQIIKDLQNILEKRKKYLIEIITKKDSQQQKIIQQQKNNIEEHIKTILIRELFIKQILNIDEHFKLIQIKKDFMDYNQLIIQQYQQLMDGWILDFQKFNIDDDLIKIQQQLQFLGNIQTQTFLIDQNHLHKLIKLSENDGEEKYQEFQGFYAYGYRFNLNKPLKINSIRVKMALLNTNLTVYILDHNDILIEKQIIESNEQNSSILKWINIPINYQIQQNYYIFIWTKPNEHSTPIIAYKESNQNLRRINEQISVRSKRAQMNKLTNIDINTKFNVVYDALFNNDDERIPAIEIILNI